jgi:transcriptional regulator GlxA family with amidase domain
MASPSRADGRIRPVFGIAAKGEVGDDRVVRRLVFVAYPGITALDLVGAHEVFAASGGYAVTIAAPEAPITTGRGPTIVPDQSLRALRGPIDTLVVVGGNSAIDAARDASLVQAVARLAARSRRVASVCTGAFLLAAAGVLDAKRVTTHWQACELLARQYPNVRVEKDPIFVRDGHIWTSAGVTAGMDLALAIVTEDMGRDAALRVARQLVMFVQRPGGQAQFSAQLGLQLAARDPIRELQSWIAEHPDADLSVHRLARRVAMSPRHFARVFRDEVGQTPASYVESTRVEAAQRLLDTTSIPVEEVARATGFSAVETLRRAFARRVGVSPREYRDHFRSARAS